MRYVKAKFKEEKEALAYRIYVSDCLYYLPEHKKLTIRYADVIREKPTKIDNRTGDEIALDVIQRLGLEVKK